MEDLIDSLLDFSNNFLRFILYAFYGALIVFNIRAIMLLSRLKKQIMIFLDKSKRENFEGIRIKYLNAKKLFLIMLIINAFLGFSLLFSVPGCVEGVISHGAGIYEITGTIVLIAYWAVIIAFIITGINIIKSGDKAEKLYRHLYPPIPTLSAYEQLKREGYTLHSDDELFETLGEKDDTSENLNLDIFGEADSELMEYVGGGKSRSNEEFTVPVRNAEDSTELVACPLCGSLNPKKAKSCDFCGAELHLGKN